MASTEFDKGSIVRPEDGADTGAILRYFEEFSKIPHGSRHTKAISDYLVEFAKANALEYRQDSADNVVIRRKASAGREGEAPIILQGHIDMVLEKNSDVAIDLETEPIELIREGDILRANGTTLGADDGAAVAMMMHYLTDESLSHPELECIFTSDEEIGMLGCEALDCSGIRGKRLINLDSESEDVITAGCAGGAEVSVRFAVSRKEKKGNPFTVTVRGLRGGHSGEMIGSGRASAVQLMGRVLRLMKEAGPFRLESVSGGNKDNAIPRECTAQILFEDSVPLDRVLEEVQRIEETLKDEYAIADPELEIQGAFAEYGERSVIKKRDAERVLRFLQIFPYGVQEYSPAFDKLPQTSLNLGVLSCSESEIRATFLVRSSVNSQKEMMCARLETIAEMLDAEYTLHSAYPAWEYKAESPFREKVLEVYRGVFGKDPEVMIIHGGVECGLLSGKIEGLECISVGPNMHEIHTPNEHVEISSIGRMDTFVRRLLEAL